MTVAASKAISDVYLGDGVQVLFAFGFKIFQNDDVMVSVNDGSAVSELDASLYSVTINPSTDGGSITLNDPLAVDYKLVITRNVKFEQKSAITGGAFLPEVFTKIVDLLTFQTQYLNEKVSRLLLFDPTVGSTPEALLEQINTVAITTALDANATEEDRLAAEAAIDAITGLVAAHNSATDPHPGKFAAANHTHDFCERGMILSNNVTFPNTVIDISPGVRADSSYSHFMKLDTVLTKNTHEYWEEGSNKGGAGISVSQGWYHVFSIYNPTTKKTDAGTDASLSAVNLLALAAGYTEYHYLGSILYNASLFITPFFQIDNSFFWKTPIQDYSGNVTATTLDLTVSAPIGKSTRAILNISTSTCDPLTNNTYRKLRVFSPYENDAVVDSTNFSLLQYQHQYDAGDDSARFEIATNTASQIKLRSSDANIIKVNTIGWVIPNL
jgi:hypothetical protein